MLYTANICKSQNKHKTLTYSHNLHADVWKVSSYGLFTMQSVFTDWITLDLNEVDARSGKGAGAPSGDNALDLQRLSAAIPNGLDKWFASGKVAVGMLGADSM